MHSVIEYLMVCMNAIMHWSKVSVIKSKMADLESKMGEKKGKLCQGLSKVIHTFVLRGEPIGTRLILLLTSSPIQPQTYDASTGLMFAAASGRSEVAHLLLASGADPNIQDTVSRVRVGNGTVECERVSIMCHGQHPPPIDVQ